MVMGGQTGGVTVGVALPVGVGVGGVIVPVGVDVEVGVLVRVKVGEGVTGAARLRKITMVWEAAFPSTILTVTLRLLRSLLINRLEGMV
jgi:hypothetical protein